MTRIRDNGTVFARSTEFQVSRTLAGTLANIVEDDDRLLDFDSQNALLIEHRGPLPGTDTLAAAAPRPTRTAHNPMTVKDVLIHELSEMS